MKNTLLRDPLLKEIIADKKIIKYHVDQVITLNNHSKFYQFEQIR